MWDQLWQKLVQVQISIVVQSDHWTGALLCLNNLYLSFRRFNEWAVCVLDGIPCTTQSTHTVGFVAWVFWKIFGSQYTGSCPTTVLAVDSEQEEWRGCVGRRKHTGKGVCLTTFFPSTARMDPRHTASSVACTSQGRHLQPGISHFPPSPCLPELPLLPVGSFLPLLHRYIRGHFLGTTAEIKVLAKMSPAASCPCWGFYAPKYPKELGELLKRKIPVFCACCWHQKKHSYFLHGSSLFEYCRSFNTALQLRTPWPRAEHGAGTARHTNPAGDRSRTHQSDWKDGHWLQWGLDFSLWKKYSFCERYTGKFHL